MTTFYDLAAANRRRSRLLLLATILLCAGVGAGIGATATALLGGTPEGETRYGAIYSLCMASPGSVDPNYDPIRDGTAADHCARSYPPTAGAPAIPPTEAAIVGGALYGGLAGALAGLLAALFAAFGATRFILGTTGARELGPDEEPELQNVVTEIALAAGISRPRVYLIEDSARNAFATGRNASDGHIVVTRGLLAALDREALAGVIGHELSHIRNLDIRFSLYLAGAIGLLALVGDAAYIGLRGASRFSGGSRKNGGALILIVLLVALVLATLAKVAAGFIRLAASREREYLADASSVELTRNPAGLERALAAIAGDPDPLVDDANSGVSHLFFANPLRTVSASLEGEGLFSTHPPIGKRIERLAALRGASATPGEQQQ